MSSPMSAPRPIDVLLNPELAAEVPAKLVASYVVALGSLREKVDFAYAALSARSERVG
jgi:hypothetical protein